MTAPAVVEAERKAAAVAALRDRCGDLVARYGSGPVEGVEDPCVECGHSTAWGSGRFVNRIPAGGVVTFDGWMCADCQSMECDRCGALDMDWRSVGVPHEFAIVCSECADGLGLDEYGVPKSGN